MEKNLKAYFAWITICIIWGTTYLAIKVGVTDLPPFLFAGFRWVIAGPIFLGILLLKGYKLPDKKDYKHIAIVGIALIGWGNILVVIGEQYLPSGIAAILITTLPFWIVGGEALLPQGPKINKLISSGLVLGVCGVIIIFGDDLNNILGSNIILGIIALLLAVMGWAFGTIYSKYKTINASPLVSASLQMIIAGSLQVIIGFSLGELPRFIFNQNSFLAFAYLTLFASILGYGSYIYAIKHLPLSLVSTYTYINPIIALFLGWLILNEELNINTIFGSVIIIIAVALVRRGNRSKTKSIAKKFI
ncbi:MAG: multidrug DMT transporter permease [Ignavibacteriales bacterium CG12_big_fil_rev_8_21_14_0_65_30_8]|nr:MAG: multidrug DMT transporter permease [Ignavibacteriales bacterium CG12_big_fil_rev_8_21_14_0_65_30_8]